MIGTTRRFNEDTQTVEWTRSPSQGHKEPPADSKESIIYRVFPEREQGKLIFQLGSSDPERAVEAARLVAADVSGIDLNAGCPKPFSTSGGMGAALLRTPEKLCAILEALVANIVPEFEIGISVKIRILETPAETEALVRRLVKTGITALTVHCRTTPMRPRERAIRDQLSMVASICHEAGIACLMNGDVETRDQGVELAKQYGADGAMIAVAAEKNSSCFRPEGVLPWREVVVQYVQFAMVIHNRFGNTKYLLGQMIPGRESVYQPMNQSKSYVELCKALELEKLMEHAQDVDAKLGLDKPKEKMSKKAKRNAAARAAAGQAAETRPRKPLSERTPGSKASAPVSKQETAAVASAV